MKSPPNLLRLLLLTGLFTTGLLPQQNYNANPDSAKEKPTQYRRTIELNKNYQSYEEKYRDQDLEKVKHSQFPLSGTGVWTELNPKVPRVTYFGIHFFNKDTGWAVGDLGALIKTTDGGLSWKVIQTNTTKPLLKVRSYNGQIVIATGYDGLILRSTDGGETFVHILSRLGSMFDLWGLELINDTVGWVCGATALLKTTDGGENWQRVNTPGYTGNMWWIDFFNEQYGFAAADGKVLRTTDGGNNWEVLQAGDNRPLYSIDVIDSLHIAAAGYGGTNFLAKNIYSSDGGYTWVNGGFLTTEEVNCIRYTDRDTGYLVMNGTGYFKTTDRGQNWVQVTNQIGEYELSIVSHNIGYSAGSVLKIYKAEGNLESWRKLILNEDFSDVFFINEYKGFVLGKILYRTTNGGVSWESNGPGGSCVLFVDSLTGFIGNPGAIWKTTDGGENWYITNGSNGASVIFFINHETGWATRNNIIYKTTNGGENWFAQFSALSSIRFSGIHFADSLYGWTANLGGRPYKTIDGGNNWIQQTNLDIWASLDIFIKSYLSGFILESNKLYKTTNGGTSFNLIPDITGFSVAAKFSTYSDNIIFITGYKSYRSINGGLSWLTFNELTGIKISKLSLQSPGIGYAVGELGLVLRYYDEALPVELTDFTGRIKENFVLLSWVTASESNNRGFLVQRRRKADKNWIDLGFVGGAGTSLSENHYRFMDELSQVGKYKYRLKQFDFNGQYQYSDEIETEYNGKFRFDLQQNFPNPFNSMTNINFTLQEKTLVKLILYDITGTEIKEILNEELESGYYSIQLNSEGLSSGIYFYKIITSSSFTSIKKLTIIK
ncbi:MAG: hypothetical protein AMXMBFR48_10300 [Ignavibacteriales bacterium]